MVPEKASSPSLPSSPTKASSPAAGILKKPDAAADKWNKLYKMSGSGAKEMEKPNKLDQIPDEKWYTISSVPPTASAKMAEALKALGWDDTGRSSVG